MVKISERHQILSCVLYAQECAFQVSRPRLSACRTFCGNSKGRGNILSYPQRLAGGHDAQPWLEARLRPLTRLSRMVPNFFSWCIESAGMIYRKMSQRPMVEWSQKLTALGRGGSKKYLGERLFQFGSLACDGSLLERFFSPDFAHFDSLEDPFCIVFFITITTTIKRLPEEAFRGPVR